jgi:hypothetical protein
VAPFSSQYGLAVTDFLDDFGLNAIYVADAGYQSPATLVAACQAELESWRVLGADLWVGGMENVPLSMTFLVSLIDEPARLPLASIRRACAQAAMAAFGATNGGYTYSARALASAVSNASPYVQMASVPIAWSASTDYALGDLVFAGGGVQQCVEQGESGLAIPSFTSVAGSIVVDGSASWVCVPYPSIGIYAGTALQLSDPEILPSVWPAALPRYTLSMNNISFQFVGPI